MMSLPKEKTQIFPYLCAVGFLGLLFFVFFQAKRLVLHDTFFTLTGQYYFLNNIAQTGQPPQWIPYLTHGTTALYWYIIQGSSGLFSNALLVFGQLLQSIDFFNLYTAGIFFEHLVLFVGTWLLSRHLYSHVSSAYFVTISVIGSSIWFNQIFWNLHLIYALPLIFYLAHRFFKNAQWRYFFLSVNLFCIQSFDKIAYLLPVTSLIVFLYVLFVVISHPDERKAFLQKISFGLRSICSIGGALLSISFLIILYKTANDAQLIQYFPDRNSDGTVNLDIFLSYAVNFKLILMQWFEFIVGFSFARDFTFYIGIFGAFFPIFCFKTSARLILKRKAFKVQ